MKTNSVPSRGFFSSLFSFFVPLTPVCLATAGILFGGCAGVTVIPLKSDGTRAKEEEGLRYYMPKPYLLVVEMPPVIGTNSPNNSGENERKLGVNSEVKDVTKNDHKAAGPDKPSDKSPTKPDSGSSSDSSGASASPSPISDTSFMAATPEYMVKLIYLPDLARPMAMRESTGLFGTVDMKPVLQDGWMLTSLGATADSKVAETLTAVAAITGSVLSSGASGISSKKDGKTNQMNESILVVRRPDHVLRPGLYRFVYDNKTGELTGLAPVVFFDAKTGTALP